MKKKEISIMGIATQGSGGNDEQRLKSLLGHFNTSFFSFDRSNKFRTFFRLIKKLYKEDFNMVVMEGTGVAGGAALILASILFKTKYIISSGDAVAPYLASKYPPLFPLFYLYEKLLYKRSAGFIGWTPYLCGRALTMGASMATTAAGWAPAARIEKDIKLKESLGIPEDNIVIGIIGSLSWNPRKNYCYGLELVRAAIATKNPQISYLIVGGGTGEKRLRRIAQEHNSKNIFFTGQVDRTELPKYLSVIDIGSLPQSVDQVGSFRYTTKICEYFEFGIPVITGQIPLSYDLAADWIWRAEGSAPWERRYIKGLNRILENLSHEQLSQKKKMVPRTLREFDRDGQVRRVKEFVTDIING